VSLVRSGICRGRVKLARTGEAITLRRRISLILVLPRGWVGLPGRPFVAAKNFAAIPDARRGWREPIPASGFVLRRNEIEAGSGRPPLLGAASAARPRGRLGVSVQPVAGIPGAWVTARTGQHLTGGKSHEYHAAA
jgi:hypothetical protein